MQITELLDVRTWRAFDVDDSGRVLAGWDDSGSVQLVELSPDGPPTVLTDLPGSCSGRYLPGERTIVVQHDDGGNERAQLSLLHPDRAWEDGSLGLTPLVHDPDYIHSLAGVLPGRVVYRTNRGNGVDFEVVLRNVSSGVEEVVYSGGGNVSSVAVSPDSRYTLVLLVGAQPVSTQLVLVDSLAVTADQRVRALTAADEHAAYENAHWLPDSSGFVLTSNHGRDLAALARYDVHDERLTWLVTDDDHELTGWLSPDGATLLVERNAEGWSELALHDGRTGEHLRDLALPTPGVVTSPYPDPRFSPDGATVVLSLAAPSVPGDVLVLDVATAEIRALTDSGAALDGPVSVPQVHRVPAADGEQIPCFTYPPTARTALAGSAVLVVHGGPEGQSRPLFSPVIVALTAAGHTVVVPNVRGSAGYGKRWVSLDDVRLRLDSVADLGAIHDWLPTVDCDPARAALYGGSYGGYMVLAGCAFQPERWRAGVDIVGMSSLVTFLENTSPYRRAAREREYGTLEHDREFLEQASPLSRIDDIQAALLVIHGANDPRVPLSEAEQLHDALTTRGVECDLLVYPDEGHGLAKRVNRMDAYPRAVEFLAKHLA
ncbi:alpha/beta fold hydrolase [Rhodococcus sp. X156]|uniref:S9 family peptidase n=1 Tax=Rhodococcus sp. X156 TaxID=2499145 RepID=UPI000FDC8B61|nr:alpha/beta fold hydrolase [Rhodococcus sp. X156]